MSAIFSSSFSNPIPVLAEMAAVFLSSVSGSSGSLSHLLSTVRTGTFSAPSSLSSSVVMRSCSSNSGDETSQTLRIKSASTASSSVEWKACTSWCGRRLTSPTVSISITLRPSGRLSAREVGSSVAKSISFASTPASVKVLSRVDLPTLVYPTIATVMTSSFFRRWRSRSRCFSKASSSCSNAWMRLRICRRSLSSLLSPGPRVPMPPPSRDRLVPSPLRRGSRYLSCASSTCRRPALVLARWAKMSKIKVVRSMTGTSTTFSMFFCWAGASS